MTVIKKTRAKEGSTYIIPVTFKNESGVAQAPQSARWTLMNAKKQVLNNRRHVAITPATTVNIMLFGQDLKVTEAGPYADRRVLIESFYNSSYGTGLPCVEEVRFQVEAADTYPVTTTTTTTTTTTA